MKKILLIFSLIFCIFCRPIFAVEEIVIIDAVATEGIYIGQTFPIGVAIYGAQPDTSFFYKIYGGIRDNLRYIQNNEFLNYDASWSSFPTSTTDSNGNAYIDTIGYIKNNSPAGYYDLYVQLAFPDYSTPTNYITFPQPIRVVPLLTTPTTTIAPTPTDTTTLTVTVKATPTPTFTSTPTPVQNSQTTPTLSPSPTVFSKKFGLLNSTSKVSNTPTISAIFNSTNPDLTTIQIGSNPSSPTELIRIQEIKPISNLKIKVFFVFLLVSTSFILYCLCFFGYTFKAVLIDINKFILFIKPQFKKILTKLKKSPQIIFKYFQNLCFYIKAIINIKTIKKKFSSFYKILFSLLKIILNIFQKFIKYNSYFFVHTFTFIKKHIKVPRKIKRYLSHKKFNISILLFMGLVTNFYLKSPLLII